MLAIKLNKIACKYSLHRSGIENAGNGKQKLICVIISKNRSYVLRPWHKLLQY